MTGYATAIRQVSGGNIVKSRDTSSSFVFELLGPDNQPLKLNGTGRLTVANRTHLAYQGDVEVTDGQFTFSFGKDTLPGTYRLEFEMDGYIFPVADTAIKVRKSFEIGDLVPAINEPIKLKALAKELKESGLLDGADDTDLVTLYNLAKI